MIFTSRSSHTENGWWLAPTGAVGDRHESKWAGALTPTVTGGGPTRAGIGSVMSHGVGPPTTMAAGIGAWNLAGFRSRTRNWLRPGFRGGKAPDTSAGRRCPHRRGLAPAALWRFTRRRLRPGRLSL